MRTILFTMFMACAIACSAIVNKKLDDRPSQPADGGTDGSVADGFCRGKSDGTDCSTPAMQEHICVTLQCVPRRCGDRFVDEDAGEQCDDGNDKDDDGCKNDCTFSCTENQQCDDGNMCNGAELCNDRQSCAPDPSSKLPPVGSECEVSLGGADAGVTKGMCNALAECISNG